MSYTDEKPTAVLDLEVYRNFFCANFKSLETGKKRHFEMYDGKPLDTASIIRILRNHRIITFNGNNYDIPILLLSLKQGVTNAILKRASDDIIVRQMKPWHLRDRYDLPEIPWLDHIDTIEPAPSVNCGLKLYGGRLHSKRLQDLPIDPDALIQPEDRETLISYCYNDLDTTIDLYGHILPQLTLRAQMSEQYGVDVRSKSDAQIAESVIRTELERIKGEKLYRPELPSDYSFKYQPPAFIRFKTQQLQDVFKVVRDATFKLKHKAVSSDDSDAVTVDGVKVKVSGIDMPKEISSLRIKMGGSKYQMGIGGLHSCEEKVANFSDEDVLIRDADVASYYPAIILNCDLFPDHLGREFLDVYRSIRERRIAAKRSKDKVTDMTLKIVLNGSFGKLGSKWSFLYSPNLMLQVTITGQLALLMLIEELESHGISVISANTDGIVSKIPRGKVLDYQLITKGWELRTGFELEFADYDALYSQSVNSYIAVKPDGSVKQKGLFAFVGSKGSPAEKNPQAYICIDAVIAYLTKNVPLEKTIEGCTDIRRFLTVRRVKGGAEYAGEYLGKVVRWYYGKGSKECIRYASNGNKVAKSDGCKPLMELPDDLPTDIDYQWYYREAAGMLSDLGVM